MPGGFAGVDHMNKTVSNNRKLLKQASDGFNRQTHFSFSKNKRKVTGRSEGKPYRLHHANNDWTGTGVCAILVVLSLILFMYAQFA
ncbi:MAG: hypothetical protein AAFU03_01800 [Bacteroidota bacterium]